VQQQPEVEGEEGQHAEGEDARNAKHQHHLRRTSIRKGRLHEELTVLFAIFQDG